MFAVLAWTAVEMERVSGLATLKADALAAMHESPFVYLNSLSPQQVGGGGVLRVFSLEGCWRDVYTKYILGQLRRNV